jgi:glycerol-3-phosphate dehydrogenase
MRRDLPALAGPEFDVVVVGGGICGAAVAWDAAQRGLSVALVEGGDFGGATSANSLKVVHGGIRYLQHLDVQRVRESSRERTALLRIAPHLVQLLPVVIPTFGHAWRGGEVLAAGFLLLNLLTSDRNRHIPDPARQVPNARLISRAELLEWLPQSAASRPTGAGVFWDGQLYNPPRLVWEFIRTAGRAGARVANYCEVDGFLRRRMRIEGVTVQDRLGGARFEVRGRVVVNAAGPFAERLHVQAGLGRSGQIPLSRDLAVVIRRPLVRKRALAIQTKYRDPNAVLSRGHRHLFLVPWREVTLIGVNSVVYHGDPIGLTVTQEEVQGFLDEINHADPSLALTPDEVALVLAGLLPIEEANLVNGEVSFGKRPLIVDNARRDGVEGLVTAVTNRYTIARLVAERVVNLVFRKLGKEAPPCRTAKIPLCGGDMDSLATLMREVVQHTVDHRADIAEQLARNHGSAYGDVLRLVTQAPRWGETIGASQTLKAEVSRRASPPFPPAPHVSLCSAGPTLARQVIRVLQRSRPARSSWPASWDGVGTEWSQSWRRFGPDFQGPSRLESWTPAYSPASQCRSWLDVEDVRGTDCYAGVYGSRSSLDAKGSGRSR